MSELKYILAPFLNDEEQLIQFPVKRKMKIYSLFFLAEKFEFGKTYSENEVNELLNRFHTFSDPATLRRELWGYHFLDRTADGRSYRLCDIQPNINDIIE